MAELPVEEKSGGSTWWMWLIVLLVLIGIIWLFISVSDAEPDVEDLGAAAPVAEEVEHDVEAVATAGAIGTLAVILDEKST